MHLPYSWQTGVALLDAVLETVTVLTWSCAHVRGQLPSHRRLSTDQSAESTAGDLNVKGGAL